MKLKPYLLLSKIKPIFIKDKNFSVSPNTTHGVETQLLSDGGDKNDLIF